jgi:hypothetical protein
VGWTGHEADEPILKGLDGLSNSNPLWIQKWFKKILTKIVKHPGTRFEVIPQMLKEAFSDLDKGNINSDVEMKYTQRLKHYAYEYNEHVRTGVLAKLLDKDKGDLVYWYVTLPTTGNNRKSFDIIPKNLNLEKYKLLLLKKLSDTLEIAGFNVLDLKSQLLQKVSVVHR